MLLPLWYLPVVYGLATLYFLLLFLSQETLSYRDVLIYLLSPITLPLTLLVRVAALFLDLDAPCFRRRP